MRQGFAVGACGLMLSMCLFGMWSGRSLDASRQPHSSLTPERSLLAASQQFEHQRFRADELRRRPQQPVRVFPEVKGKYPVVYQGEGDLPAEDTAEYLPYFERNLPYIDLGRDYRADYDEIISRNNALLPGDAERVAKASWMPATVCRSVEPVLPDGRGPFSAARWAHELTIDWFISQAGFGSARMGLEDNERGITMANGWIDRVELVSLLLHDDPCVYVLDEVATPKLARGAHRRPLDEFELRGLDAVRQGAELVWTKEAPTRMFGAIRADAGCLNCHSGARENELLGAFTYYLDLPVDQMQSHRPRPHEGQGGQGMF